MLQRLRNKNVGLIGLDIRDDAVKLVTMNASHSPLASSPISSIHFSSAQLPEGAVSHGEINDRAAVIDAIVRARKAAGIGRGRVAVALPGTVVVSKSVTVEAGLSDPDLEALAWHEAGKLFPGIIDDIYLDFLLDEGSGSADEECKLHLIACRKRNVRHIMDVVKAAGLKPTVVDVDFYVLQRSIGQVDTEHHPAPSPILAVFDLHTTRSTMIVLQGDTLLHTNCEVFTLEKELFAAHYADVICQQLQLYEANTMSHPVEKCVFSGDNALLSTIISELTSRMTTEMIIADLSNVVPVESNAAVNCLDSSYLCCYGLALRDSPP